MEIEKQRYALQGEVCPHCDVKIFPPRDVCPACGGEAKTPFTFSGLGEVYSLPTLKTRLPDLKNRRLTW